MGKLSKNDLQFLRENPDFHVVGSTFLGVERRTNSNGSHTRSTNDNDQHVFEMHRTYAQRLREADLYENLIEQ